MYKISQEQRGEDSLSSSWSCSSSPLQIHPSLTLSRLYHSKTQQAQRNINEQRLRGKRLGQKLALNVSHERRHALTVLMQCEKFTGGHAFKVDLTEPRLRRMWKPKRGHQSRECPKKLQFKRLRSNPKFPKGGFSHF